MKKLYVYTTNDKYQLPIAVGDSPKELADRVGLKPESILSRISHGLHNGIRSNCFRIEYSDEEWNDD